MRMWPTDADPQIAWMKKAVFWALVATAIFAAVMFGFVYGAQRLLDGNRPTLSRPLP